MFMVLAGLRNSTLRVPLDKMLAALVSPYPVPRDYWHRRHTNRPLQHSQELLNARVLLLAQLTLAPEQTRIKLGREQRVLKALDHPVDNRHHHFQVEVIAKFAALQTETHETNRTIRIFADEEAVYLPLEHQVGAVVSKKRDAVRNPVFMHQMFGTHQPVAQDRKEPGLPHF